VVLGGFAIGIVEAVGAGVISSGYREAISMLFFLVILSFRRQGLLGGAGAGAV
jgi:branched-chain amino acid transport system permease protein